MTDASTIGQDPSIDSDEIRELRRRMVTTLIADGVLSDGRWHHAFFAVPRHVLVPGCYQGSEYIDGEVERQRWLQLIYSDATVITQRRAGAVTSSGTMPSLLAMMLQALEVEDGHRVLQVATGTGYTAALLCERLNARHVTSIDIDPDLTTAARDRLLRCGYAPALITADGAHGHSGGAPYDRIVVTFGVRRLPPAWIDQTRAGGIIVAPVCSGLTKITVTGPGMAQGPFIGSGYFMRHRTTAHESAPTHPGAIADKPRWPSRIANLPSTVYYDNDFRFFLDVTMPGLAHGYPYDDPHNLTISARDGSHAHLTSDGELTQFGPRRIWDDIEAAHHAWCALQRPPRERFGLTVTPQHQTIWLDAPDSNHRWAVG